MKKIRKGKTVHIRWHVNTNGEATSLEGRDLTLYLAGGIAFNRKVIPFIVSGNVIEATIQGKDLNIAGLCKLALYENRGKDNQTVLDTDAFMLVDRTKDEGIFHCAHHHSLPGQTTPDEGLDTETIDIETGNLELFCGGSVNDEMLSLLKKYFTPEKSYETSFDDVIRIESWGYEIPLYYQGNDKPFDKGAKAILTIDWEKTTIEKSVKLSVLEGLNYVNIATIRPGDTPIICDVYPDMGLKEFNEEDDYKRFVGNFQIITPALIERMESRIAELEAKHQ